MPFIISTQSKRAGHAELTIKAQTALNVATLKLSAATMELQHRRATLLLASSSRTRQGSASLQALARTAPFYGRAGLNLIATTHATQTGSAVIVTGRKPRTFRLGGAGSPVLSFDYSRTARGQEMTLVLAGERRVTSSEFLTVQIQALNGPGTQTLTVPCDGEYSIERLPGGGARTTLRGIDPDYAKLENTRLPEMIPWLKDPSREVALPGYRSITRQVIPVTQLIDRAFRLAGQTLIFGQADVLQEQQWEETRRETSTLGKSPLALWQEAHGAVGYELVWIAPKIWKAYRPGEVEGYGTPVDPGGVLPGNETRKTLQYPAGVRIQVGDNFTSRDGYLAEVAVQGGLPDQALDQDGKAVKVEQRDKATSEFEVRPDAELTGQTLNEDRTESVYYIQKLNGRVVRTIDVTLGNMQAAFELTARPGEKPRDFSRVVLAYTETTNTYLTALSSTLASTRSVSKRYAYAYDVVLTPTDPPAAFKLGIANAGALLGEETSSEVYVYSHAGGHLRTKTRSEERITAIKQANADSTDPASPPGPPEALERSRTVTTETWTPVGEGQWRHGTSRTHAAKLPVQDTVSGDWVKQISAPVVSAASETTDNAPPSVSDPNIPDPAAQTGQQTGPAPMFDIPPAFQYLRDPMIQTVDLTGTAPRMNVSLPMVEDFSGEFTRLLGKMAASEFAPTTIRTLRSAFPELLQLRKVVDGYGMVRSYRLSGKAGSLSLEATCDTPDLV